MQSSINTRKHLGETTLLFATGVFLDCLAHSHVAEDAQLLGIAPSILGGVLTMGTNVVANGIFQGWQNTKEAFKGDLNSHLELAINKAINNTFEDIRTEVISDYQLTESKKERIFRYFFLKENNNYNALQGLNEEFLSPLKKRLIDNDVIEKMLSQNEQLEPDNYLLTIIKEVTPSYYHESDAKFQGFTTCILEKFKRLYKHNFLQQLKAEDKAKTVYFSHLLESILRGVNKIGVSVEGLKNNMHIIVAFVEEAGISLKELNEKLSAMDNKLDFIAYAVFQILNNSDFRNKKSCMELLDTVIGLQNTIESWKKKLRISHNREKQKLISKEIERQEKELDKYIQALQEKVLNSISEIIVQAFLYKFLEEFSIEYYKDESVIKSTKLNPVAKQIVQLIQNNTDTLSYVNEIDENILALSHTLNESLPTVNELNQTLKRIKKWEPKNHLEAIKKQAILNRYIDHACDISPVYLKQFNDLALEWQGTEQEKQDARLAAYQCTACRKIKMLQFHEAEKYLNFAQEERVKSKKFYKDIKKNYKATVGDLPNDIRKDEMLEVAYYEYLWACFYFRKYFERDSKHKDEGFNQETYNRLKFALEIFSKMPNYNKGMIQLGYIHYMLYHLSISFNKNPSALKHLHEAGTIFSQSVRLKHCSFDFSEIESKIIQLYSDNGLKYPKNSV